MPPKKLSKIILTQNGSIKKKPTQKEKYKEEEKRLKKRDTVNTKDGPKDMG